MAAENGTPESQAPAAAPSADPLKEALRREQRAALLWWLPQGAVRFASGMGGLGPVATAFLESAWFPLCLILAGVACFGAAISVLGLPFSFIFWLSYLGAVVYVSRYSVAESVISGIVIIGFAIGMCGFRLSEFQPTLYFVFTIAFLSVVLGLSHASLFRRTAEQSVTIQRLTEQLSAAQKAPRPEAGEASMASMPSMARIKRPASGTLPPSPPSGGGAGDTAVVAHLANLTSTQQKDSALSSFQAALTSALGVISAQIWRVTDQGSVLVLFKNIGPPSVPEGTTIDASSDEFLSWFLKQRRVVVFEPGEKASLEKQFGESLPTPLLPMAAMGTGSQVAVLLRVTASARKAYTSEDRKILALVVALTEGAFNRTGVFQ